MAVKRMLVTITPPAVTALAYGISAALPPALVGAPFTGELKGIGGAGGYSFAGTGLPAGLTLHSTGEITGTPTTEGYVEFVPTVTDVNTATASQTFSIHVKSAVSIKAFFPAAEVGIPYSVTMMASGGTAPYTWTTAGTLPPGLTQTGDTISGTPTTAGTSLFSVTATDSSGTPKSAKISAGINVAAAIALTGTFPDAIVGVWYQSQLEVTGGVPPFQFGVTGTFQFNLSPTGLVSGYGMFPDTETPTFTVTDALGGVATFSPTWDVVTPGGSATATVQIIEREFLGAANGDERYVYFPANFQLTGFVILQQPLGNCTVDPRVTTYAGFPAGSGDSIAGGTPPSITAGKEYKNTSLAGWSAFIAADSTMALHLSGLATATNISVTLFGFVPNTTITPVVLSGSLANGTVGVPYSDSLTIAGGIAPYSTPVFSPALPSGLTATVSSSTIVVAGTPTTGGAYSGTASVMDSFGQTSNSLPVAFSLAYATLVITGAFTDTGIGAPMAGSLTVSGGDGSYTLTSATPTGIPAGSHLTLTGSTITDTGATTTAGGPDTFIVQVTSGDGQTANSPQSVTVNNPVIWESIPTYCATNITVSNAGLSAENNGSSGGAWGTTISTVGYDTDDRYAEITKLSNGSTSGDNLWGLTVRTHGVGNYPGHAGTDGIGYEDSPTNPTLFQGGSLGAASYPTFGVGDTVGLVYRGSLKSVWIRSSNGSGWVGGGDPALGTSPTFSGLTAGVAYFLCFGAFTSPAKGTVNFGHTPFVMPLPSGILPWGT